MDIISKEQRSWNMSRIRDKDTTPEKSVRSLLHKLGYRFRIHNKDLPGKPDIVLTKYKTVIFVNGCFWHRHPGCKFSYKPKSHIDFWKKKFKDNIERFKHQQSELTRLGWHVIVIWECETSNQELIINRVNNVLNSSAHIGANNSNENI